MSMFLFLIQSLCGLGVTFCLTSGFQQQ